MKSFVTISLLLSLCLSMTAPAQESASTPGLNPASTPAGFLPFPKEISYQGLLTTSSGTPAADGDYTLQFDLFNILAGGVSLWTETQATVTVSRGVFTVRLGSVTPLPDIFFQQLFLEVAATSGPGIGGTVTFTPRTELAASAYSLAPWETQGNDVTYTAGNVGVGTSAPDPSVKLDVEGHDLVTGRFTNDSLNSAVHVLHAEVTAVGNSDIRAVYGQSTPADYYGYGGYFQGGYAGVRGVVSPTGSSSYYGVWGSATGGTGTNRGVYGTASGGATNYAGYFAGRLRVATAAGDSAAMLPTDAISATEILDEPGFASHSAYNSISVPSATTVTADSVTITIPSDGYIVVEAGGMIQHPSHVTGTLSKTWLNIHNVGGVTPGGDSYQTGHTDDALPSGSYYYTFHTHRTYQQAQGTYSFYLNARNTSGVNNHVISYKWIQATFYPTSYGAVSVMAPGIAPAAAIGGVGEELAGSNGGNPRTSANGEVDLRELEIRALRARAAAEVAEEKLLEAEMAAEKEKGSPDQR